MKGALGQKHRHETLVLRHGQQYRAIPHTIERVKISWKKAEVASLLTTIDEPNIWPDLKFILLDEDLAQGYSGGPVFVSPEPRMKGEGIVVGGEKLIGVASMVKSDKTGGKIALIVPISYLKEVFQSEEYRKFREEYGKAKQ